MSNPIKLHLTTRQGFTRTSSSATIQTGGTRGVSAAFELKPGDYLGFPGVWVRWKDGAGFVPIVSCSRVDFDRENLPEDALRAFGELEEPEEPDGVDAALTGALSPDIDPDEYAKSLAGLDRADLRKLASKRGISGYSTMKKAELVEALGGTSEVVSE